MTRTRPDQHEVSAIQSLIERSRLQDVDFHEVSARKTPENKQNNPDEDNVEVSMRLHHHVGDRAFGILFSVRLVLFKGEMDVAVAAEYVVEDDEPIDSHIVKAFGNEVAVMVLFPYVRETVSTLSTKVWEKPFILPTLERGFVGFDLDETELES